ncbi:MAG: glycerate kinase [Bacteroidales bacterium]|nr:glycerate kinase [Bacteroidales bacterium]
MLRIVIASDSFKGSLSSSEVAEAVTLGITDAFPDNCVISSVAIADGGEGTIEAILKSASGTIIKARAHDPLGRPAICSYAAINGDTAIIETAQASGLTLLNENERNPLNTSSYGTGELIMDALERGFRKFIIGLGGSATNDGGTGMLEALGYRFFDKEGERIYGCCGGKLEQIALIDSSEASAALEDSYFTVACDVNTTFCGPQGATMVFSAQKGADVEMQFTLEKGMLSLSEYIKRKYGKDLENTPGAGAAGGLGGAFYTFLNSRIISGIDMILDTVGFDDMIRNADLVITGEGRIDSQTAKGKVVSGVLARCSHINIPVIAIAGIIDMTEDEKSMTGFKAILPIQPRPVGHTELQIAMKPENTIRNIRNTIFNYFKNEL